MAQKASPRAIRLGYNQEWDTYFFPEVSQGKTDWLKIEKLIRDYFFSLFPDIARLKIDAPGNHIFIYLYVPEINLVLGENNEKLEKVLKELYQIVDEKGVIIKINLFEEKKNAQSIANFVKSQLEKRIRFRRVLNEVLAKYLVEREIKGVKIRVNGLVDGLDIAQKKNEVRRKMKLSTIDSNIEEGKAEAIVARGLIGIQILLYKGRIWQNRNKKEQNHLIR